MVFIDKTTPHSTESRNRLESWKALLDLAALYAEPNQTGDSLWAIEDYEFQNVKDKLREDLAIEQGGICCYCCQSFRSIRTKIEHFLAKSAPDRLDKPQAFAERVFNYGNLLLSCDGGETSQKPYEVKVNRLGSVETQQEVADRLGVSTELLDRLNPSATYRRGEKIKYTEGVHCDTYKGDKTQQILNPTAEVECWTHFDVKTDGSMSVNITTEDASITQRVENTLSVLNLNESRLMDKRKTAWGKFEDALIEQEEFQATFPDEEKLHAYLQDYLEMHLESDKESQNKVPFCFVNYHVIRSI